MKIILAHRNIDFDALASMVALQKLYPETKLVIDGKLGPYVQDFLALAKEQLPYYKLKDLNLTEIKKVFLVDTGDLNRAVTRKEHVQRLKEAELEIIDHHPYFYPIKENITIDLVGACTTIIVEKLIARGAALSKFEATLMALGIYDDTGSLLFESTTARDVSAVAYLLEQGAQLSVVAEYLHKPLTPEQMELFQQLLDNGITEKLQGMPVYFAHAENDEYLEGLALLAHRVGEIQNTMLWFIVVRMEERIYIVGRAKGNGLAVNRILEVFGGGGHERAASAVVKNNNISAIIETIREEISRLVKTPHLVRDIMSYPVKTVRSDTKMQEVGQMLLKYGHTGVPVVEDDRLVGVISRRDVDKALKHGLKHAPVKGFMTQEVVTVEPDLSWEEVQKLMVQNDIGRLPVLEEGKLVGIVSRSDVLRLIYGSIIPSTVELVQERSRAKRKDILRLIKSLPQDIQGLMQLICHVTDELDYKAYLVGGFVRDLLLGTPSKDLDVVVEGDGMLFAKIVSKRIGNNTRLLLHSEFGTARIVIDEDIHLDIAGSRREDYASPGALPTVEGSTLKDDLFRRDFTINAMALCLSKTRYGEVVDYYGGLRDLEQKEIRFLHNLSFIEDPTRILRGVRFAGRYGFKFAKITRDAVTTALQANIMSKISAERFTEELLLIYAEPNYQNMGQKLIEFGVLESWFGQDYAWNFREEEKVSNWQLEKRWLMSIKDIEDGGIIEILDKLRVNKQLTRLTHDYLRSRQELKRIDGKKLEAYDLLSGVSEIVLDTMAAVLEFTGYITEYRNLKKSMNMEATGKKLREMGIEEGPEIGRILKEIRNEWLKGNIKSPADEKNYLRKFGNTK